MSKKTIWSKAELESALDISISSLENRFGKIEFNSNNIVSGDIFITLSEGDGDGHDYVLDAINRGAHLVILEKTQGNIPIELQAKVNNSLQALYTLAEFRRNQVQAKIVAITGSVGKTTTRYILEQMLLQNISNVFCSQKNYNNYIGVPLMMASLPYKTEIAVFEIGMCDKNEISPLAKLLKPDIAIITEIAPAHLINFASVEAIADSKMEIFDGLDKDSGIAIIPGSSLYSKYMKGKIQSRGFRNILTFGLEDHNNAIYSHYNGINAISSFNIRFEINAMYHCTTPLYGKHNMHNISCALLTSKCLGIDIDNAISCLGTLEAFEGRGNLLKVNFHGKIIEIIDDTYNASPFSMQSSIEQIQFFKGNCGVVLGSMLELGKKSQDYHMALLPYIIKANPIKLILVGSEMKCLYFEIEKYDITCYYFEDILGLWRNIEQIIYDLDSILLKGSNSIKLHKIIHLLTQGAKQ